MPLDLEYKFQPLSLDAKAATEGVIEGYGAIFGNVDQGGDLILPGAFTESLASGRRVKMLREHCPEDVLGVWDKVGEDDTGLRVKGQIVVSIQDGKDALELVKAGAIDGLSIGYRTIESDYNNAGVRILKKLELWEVSLVTFPMNVGATIDSVKAAGLTEREFERKLMQDAGLSRSVARALMAGGLKAVKGAKQDAGDQTEALVRALRARAAL